MTAAAIALETPEVVEELTAMDSATIQHLRMRAQKQLYFTAKGIMGYKDVNRDTHGKFCAFIQRSGKMRRLALMPRSHLKSSIATEADSLRLALDDPEDARILIVNEIEQNAKDFLRTVKNQFEKNTLLQALFPELVLDRFTGPGIVWNTEMATLPRSTTYKEPTFMAIGVGGAATSKHFTRIKADDLIGLEAKRSPAEMLKAINWNRNIDSLAISAVEGVIDWIGTRWARNDIYQDIIDRYGDTLGVFTRSAIENGEIIFPQKFTWQFYQTLIDTSPDIWFSQYMNDPKSEMGQDIPSAGSYRFNNEGEVVYRKNGVEQKWERGALDRVITVDPNGGSKTAPDEASVIVTGQAPTEDAFCLQDKSGRPSPSELVDWVYEMATKWRPRVIGIEEAGQQNTLFYFKEKMRQEGIYFNVVPLKPYSNTTKEDRIREAIEPLTASHRLYLLPSQDKLRNQIENYPDVKNDDRIDALSYAPQLWRKPMSIEQQKKNSSAVQMILNRRSSRTGY